MKIDKRDKLFSLIVRTRDNWTCTRCGKYYEPPTRALHCSHYFSRRHKGTRWDLDNAVAHCYGCHSLLGSNPTDFRSFMLNRLGQKQHDILEAKHRKITKFTKYDEELIYLDLKQKMKELTAQLEGMK